jgi:hypothetical protein
MCGIKMRGMNLSTSFEALQTITDMHYQDGGQMAGRKMNGDENSVTILGLYAATCWVVIESSSSATSRVWRIPRGVLEPLDEGGRRVLSVALRRPQNAASVCEKQKQVQTDQR